MTGEVATDKNQRARILYGRSISAEITRRQLLGPRRGVSRDGFAIGRSINRELGEVTVDPATARRLLPALKAIINCQIDDGEA